MTIRSSDRAMVLTTPLGSDLFTVTRFRGKEALSEPFHYEIDLLAEPTTEIAFEQMVGQEATLRLRPPVGADRYFSGRIRRFTEGDSDLDATHYRVELVPAFALLTHRVRSRVFQQLSVDQILPQVLEGVEGLKVTYHLAPQGAYPVRNYCAQYRESDFAFACRLMEEEGIRYYFEHFADRHEMVVSDQANHPDLEPVAVHYNSAREGTFAAPRIWHWEKSQVVTPARWTVWDQQFQRPDSHFEGTSMTLEDLVDPDHGRHRLRQGVNQSFEVFEGRGGYARWFDGVGPNGEVRDDHLTKIDDEAHRQARLRMEEGTARALDTRGNSDCAQLTPGFAFELMDHRRVNGRFLLARVEHDAEQPGFRSGQEQLPFRYENSFTCLRTDMAFRPPRTTPRPVIAGTQTATVVGPAGRKTFLDRYGRVKVKFHWDRDGSSSCWIRVGQLWAGNGWGAFFWPRVGHEVIISFEDGDPDRPLVVGSVYNNKNMPPFEMPQHDLIAGIKSCSVGGDVNPQANFNGILFHDEAGNEHVEVHSEKHERARTESDKQMRVGRNLTTVVGALPSAGSGSGGGSLDSDGWGWIKPTLGRSINFVCGYAADVDLGSYSQCVVGQNYLIATNPLAFQLWAAGSESAAICQGIGNGISGSVEVVLGGLVECRYGPKVEVHRGPCLETTAEASRLMVGLVGLLNGCAVSSNILAAMVPDKIDPVIVALKALEALILGSLCALETKEAWLEQAEVNSKLAKECLEFLRSTYETKLKWQGFSGQNLGDEIKTLVKDAAAALKGLDKGAMVHDCSAYVLSAQKRAVLAAHDKDGEMLIMSPTVDVMVSRQFGLRGKYLNFLSDAATQMGGKTVEIKGTSKVGEAGFDLDDKSIKASIDGHGPELKMTREGGITLKAGRSEVSLTDNGIVLKFGKQSLTLGPTGVRAQGTNIALEANLVMKLKSPLLNETIDGKTTTKGAVVMLQ